MMKKLLIVAVICLMIAVMPLAVSAQVPHHPGPYTVSAKTPVVAIVKPYACVDWIVSPKLMFRGFKGEEEIGIGYFSLINNCPVKISFDCGVLKNYLDGSTIKTLYTWDQTPNHNDHGYWIRHWNDYVTAPHSWGPGGDVKRGRGIYGVGVKGILGEIDGQSAGIYSTSLTVTVTSQLSI